MRDSFQTTIVQFDSSSGALTALSNIEVSVYLPGGVTLATIFQRRTGSAQGPAPEASASGGPNPFVTGPSGAVEFWVPAGVYEVHIRDLNGGLPRITNRGLASGNPPIEFNSSPASAGSMPTSVLAADAGITLAHVSGEILRQVTQIGEIISWWRPNSLVPIPAGFEICDNRVLLATAHDFGTGVSITLPDLRGAMIIGADTPNTPVDYRTIAGGRSTNLGGAYVGDAAQPGAIDPGIPGIRGAGGVWSRDFNHSHLWLGTVASHAHQHAAQVGGRSGTQRLIGPGNAALDFATSRYDFVDTVTIAAYELPSMGNVDLTERHIVTSTAVAPAVTGVNGGPTQNINSIVDVKGRYVGLLLLMKVRRS